MKPVAQVRSYHYWSARLTEKVLEDNVERLPRETEFQIGSSSIGAFKSKNPGYATTRAGKALIIEELLSDHIVEDFDYRGPIDYLRAVTPLVIGSLRAGDGPTLPNDGSGNDSGAVYLFTESITQDGQRVAVCLFGSAKNILDHEPNVPLWRQYGWTCSHYAGLKILLHCAPSSESYCIAIRALPGVKLPRKKHKLHISTTKCVTLLSGYVMGRATSLTATKSSVRGVGATPSATSPVQNGQCRMASADLFLNG